MKELVNVGVSWDGVKLQCKLTYGPGWRSYVESPAPRPMTRTLRTTEPPFVEREWIYDVIHDMARELNARAARVEELSCEASMAQLSLDLTAEDLMLREK